MKITETPLPGVLLLELDSFPDDRGRFFEVFHAGRYEGLGRSPTFVQDSFSSSRQGVLRGLHFQYPRPQGKLVQVLRGRIFDVAVDLRRSSPHFRQWFGIELSSERPCQLWIPPGFAHGFCTLTDVDFFYKCTDVYAPACDQAVRWNDPDLAITWPVAEPLLSAKDSAAPLLRDLANLPP